MRVSIVLVLAAVSTLACAGSAWELARVEDSPSAYHRFLSDYADSDYASQARARLALVRLRSHPTAVGWNEFRAEFPDETLLAELRPSVAPILFERTRAAGTASAYREFLADFNEGEFAERARGNLEFLTSGGFEARADELAAFAARHPASDYSVEARRSAEAIQLRDQSGIRTVGLSIEIAPGTPNPERLIRVFRERAMQRYAEAGIALISLAGEADPRAASLPVRLTIRHQEEAIRADFSAERGTAAGVLARTRVTLARTGDADPIWSDEFAFRAGGAVPGADSVVFGVGAQAYWASFFVPAVSWQTNVAVRAARGLGKPVASLAMSGSRAFVLFTDGDLEMFDLGDPERPAEIGSYRRKRDLSRWSGLHLLGDQVVIFGPDGIEVLALRDGRFVPTLALDRGVVGSIVAVENLGREIVAAGNRGLVLVDPGKGQREILLERPLQGLARSGDRLLFSDGTSLFVSTLPLLRERRVDAELRLGRGFGPGLLRVDGDHVVVLGQRSVGVVDVSLPARPILVSRVEASEAGEIRDAARIGGRLFLLGERGLQLTDAQGARVVDAACVTARWRLTPAGRHLVMIGEKSLQVVDATPFVSEPAMAAPHP